METKHRREKNKSETNLQIDQRAGMVLKRNNRVRIPISHMHQIKNRIIRIDTQGCREVHANTQSRGY